MTPSEPTSQDPRTIPDIPHEAPLQGWKEISAFLDRDVSTARRWEREAGLPIRRHRTDRRSSVYAYASEIEAWRGARPPQSESDAATPLWRRRTAWAGIGLALSSALLIAYGPILNPRSPVAEAAEDSMRAEQVFSGAAADSSSRISSDGRWLTHADWSTGELWLRDVATGLGRAVSNDGDWQESTSYVESSAISPEGRRIAAAWFNHEIGNYEFRVGPLPAEGETDEGASFFQCDRGCYIEVVGWLDESRALFVQMAGQTDIRLMIADVEASTSSPLKTFDWRYPADAVVSPDGVWVAYGVKPDPVGRQHDVFVLAADGSAERAAVEHPADDFPVAWTPDGSHLLFRSSRTPGQSLWALPLKDGKRTGEPRMLSAEFSSARHVGFSPAGDLYYLKPSGSRDVYEAKIDLGTGRLLRAPEKIPAAFVGDNIDPAYSPDGRWMAYLANRTLNAIGGYAASVIVIRNLETGAEHEFAPPAQALREVFWAPDSGSLLFKGKDDKARFAVYRLDASSGESELLFHPEPASPGGNFRSFGWMADSRSVFYRDTYNARGSYWVHDLETGDRRRLLKGGSRVQLTLSPDGLRFAGIEERKEQGRIILFTLDARTGHRQDFHSFDGPEHRSMPPPLAAAWTPDQRSLLFWKRVSDSDEKQRRNELWMAPLDGGDARKTELSAVNLVRPSEVIRLHPDGERVAFSGGDLKYEIWKLSNFLDRLTASD